MSMSDCKEVTEFIFLLLACKKHIRFKKKKEALYINIQMHISGKKINREGAIITKTHYIHI